MNYNLLKSEIQSVTYGSNLADGTAAPANCAFVVWDVDVINLDSKERGLLLPMMEMRVGGYRLKAENHSGFYSALGCKLQPLVPTNLQVLFVVSVALLGEPLVLKQINGQLSEPYHFEISKLPAIKDEAFHLLDKAHDKHTQEQKAAAAREQTPWTTEWQWALIRRHWKAIFGGIFALFAILIAIGSAIIDAQTKADAVAYYRTNPSASNEEVEGKARSIFKDEHSKRISDATFNTEWDMRKAEHDPSTDGYIRKDGPTLDEVMREEQSYVDAFIRHYDEARNNPPAAAPANPVPAAPASTPVVVPAEVTPHGIPNAPSPTPEETPDVITSQSTPVIPLTTQPEEPSSDHPQDLILKIEQYLNNHDFEGLAPYLVDGHLNYFGHRRCRLEYVQHDMGNDAINYPHSESKTYPDTFAHEVSTEYSPQWTGPMIYDSINVYSEITEKNGHLHRATTRLTVGYTSHDNAILVYSLTMGKVQAGSEPNLEPAPTAVPRAQPVITPALRQAYFIPCRHSGPAHVTLGTTTYIGTCVAWSEPTKEYQIQLDNGRILQVPADAVKFDDKGK